MSNVSSMHDVVKYDGKNKPLDGQVLLTYTFKKVTKDSMAATDYGLPVDFKPQNSAASVPKITDAELLAAASELVPFMQDLVHDTRRTILRDVVLTAESAIKKGQPASWVLSTDQVSLSAVIKRLQDEATGGSSGRFSKAVLEDWFNGVVAPVLLQGMMTKQGIPADEPDDSPRMFKLLSILQAVFDTMSDVVFSKKKPSQDLLDKIELVISKVSAAGVTVETDTTLKLVQDKIDSWKGKVTEDWLDAL